MNLKRLHSIRLYFLQNVFNKNVYIIFTTILNQKFYIIIETHRTTLLTLCGSSLPERLDTPGLVYTYICSPIGCSTLFGRVVIRTHDGSFTRQTDSNKRSSGMICRGAFSTFFRSITPRAT